MKYRYLFGPVPSRRLGTSLGIDLTPDKSCSLNCVYCECGRTDHLTLERKEYVPTQAVLDELRNFLSARPHLDSITFSGSGEPTLHSGIGTIIRMLKEEFPEYTVTVLTNSSLLHLPDVRSALNDAHRVIPSLDAISESAFRQINRPFHKLTSAQLINGLEMFCREFSGEIWLEIFIVPGINDTPEELSLFRNELTRLKYDRIQLNTLDRPGAVDWIEPVSAARLRSIADLLGIDADIVSSHRQSVPFPTLSMDVRERILSTVRIRPCTSDDLVHMLKLPQEEVDRDLEALIAEGLVEPKRQARGIFYGAVTAT